MKTQAVLFDMDGVLVDSEPVHAQLVVELARARGIQLSPADFQDYVGRSPLNQWEDLCARFGLDEAPEDIAAGQIQAYYQRVRDGQAPPVMPGVLALIEGLQAAGVKLAVASSNASRTVAAVVEALGLGAQLQAWVGGDEVARPKPAPDVFLEAAARVGVPAEACVVIEDSAHGVRAAHAAGMRVFGFENPSSFAQDLRAADRVFHRFSELDLAALLSP